MKPDTQLHRIRSFCEKVIARSKAKEERYGKAGSWDDQVRRDMAERMLRMMEKGER